MTRRRLYAGARRPRPTDVVVVAEVDAAGLAYERAVFDLAAKGVHVRSLPASRRDHWLLVATHVGPGDQRTAEAALRSYFGDRLRRCRADSHPA